MVEETVSGIHLNENGERVVGGSIRADGSVRKTLKVRPGYKPAEDTKRYNIREVMAQKEKTHTSPTQNKNSFPDSNKLIKSNNETNKEVKGLESSLSNLNISNEPKIIKSVNDDLKPKLSTQQKRKPQRRKKYTLADLDNS